MPFNLPGDDIDNIEKLERYEETKQVLGFDQQLVNNIGEVFGDHISGFALNEFSSPIHLLNIE